MSKNNPKNQPDSNQYLTRVQGRSIWIHEPHSHPMLHEFWSAFSSEQLVEDESSVWLSASSGGMGCCWHTAGKALQMDIDVDKFASRQKSYPAKRGGVLNQALGKRTQRIADMTGGWGGDAMLLASQGYRVHVFERHPLMAVLLKDAMQRLASTPWVKAPYGYVPEVRQEDATSWLDRAGPEVAEHFDCLYLDPMFPPKRKSSAAPNKQMQFLQWLLGREEDATILLEKSLDSGVKRVVVKRPKYAEPLMSNPEQRFSGKLVHYDVYLNNG